MGRRIGILGGTFDPPHYGHLTLAQEALIYAELEKVIFVPAGQPPHKPGRPVTPATDRLQMLTLAIAGDERFTVSSWEIEQPGPSFTVNTVSHFRRLYPDAELFFIMGTDSLLEFTTWRQAGEIVRICRVLAGARPGTRKEEVASALMAMPQEWQEKITVMYDVPGFYVSSTLLRERIKQGLPVRYLLPDVVAAYIEEKKLYR